MQAGLAKRQLSFREVFTSQAVFFLLVLIAVLIRNRRFDYKSVSVRRSDPSTTVACRRRKLSHGVKNCLLHFLDPSKWWK